MPNFPNIKKLVRISTQTIVFVGLRSSYLNLQSKSSLDQVQRNVKHRKGLRLLSLLQLGEFTTDYNITNYGYLY